MFLFWLGTIDPQRVADAAKEGGKPLPSMHSDLYYPVPAPVVRTGVRTMSMAVLNLLVQIGDKAVADKLSEKYPSFQPNEKAQVLNGLKQFRHPKFREYAGAALLTNDSTLVSTAATALQQEGHPEGEKLLVEALDKQTTSHLIHNITNALSNFGTPTARAALLKAKESKDANKKNYATNALLQMRQRSPGFQYIFQAQQRLQTPIDKKDKDAKTAQEKEALEFYDMAIQLDPQLAEAYAGRGKVMLRQNKLADAGKDFEKALELKLEPEDSEVITGLALARVVDGKLEEGIKLVEDNREKLKAMKEGLYAYNAACVYSRACEYLDGHKDVPDRDKKREDYRQKSLADLATSIKQGFNDFDWMAEDPDFAALREDADSDRAARSSEPQRPLPTTLIQADQSYRLVERHCNRVARPYLQPAATQMRAWRAH